jgi:threonine aldolase
MKIQDLRSDTLTQPSEDMRLAMSRAIVGDDVYEEDPTVKKLEAFSADLLKKEAAILTTSGTQANLIASILLNPPGSEVIADHRSHLFVFECANTARFAGTQIRPISTTNGIITGQDIINNIRTENVHYPKTTSVFIENTHNLAGGKVYPISTLREISDICKNKKIKIHIDGARLFNASEKLGVKVSDIACYADSITFCLSKGLGCPIGSILAGSKEYIKEARRIRKALGGGMRQAGILAAAGMYALENNISKLKTDHAHAEELAKLLLEFNQEIVYPETNLLIWKPTGNAVEIINELKLKGLLTGPIGENNIRMVTHLDITTEDMIKIKQILREYLVGKKK